MNDDVLALIAANGGYLHRESVVSMGGSDAHLRHWVRAGWLTRIRVGTYALTRAIEECSPEQRHLLLARSVVDKFEPGTVALSHHSAAVAHGLAIYDVDLRTVHLTRLDDGAGRTESGVHHHRRRPATEVVLIGGRPVVAPLAAAWQVACTTSRRGGLVVMDSALSTGLVTSDELLDDAGSFTSWRGARRARLGARAADAGAETPAESLLRYVCIESDLPQPETQFCVFDDHGGLIARSDLGWHEYRHLAEVDGRRKYVRDLRPGQDASDAVIREKLREDRARGRWYGMTRATWADVQPMAARATAARLRHDLDQSRRLYGHGRRVIV